MPGARPPDFGWVSAGILAPIVALLQDEGKDVDRALAAGNVRREDLQDPAFRITIRAATLVWQSALRQVPDPNFGLRAALLTETGDFDLLVCLARSCATFGQALRLGVQYAALLDEMLACRLQRVEGGTLLSLGPRSAQYLPAVAEYVLLRLVLLGRQLLGDERDPIEVHFAHRRPKQLTLHRKLFRATLRFECRELGLLLDPAVLDEPMPVPDPVLQRVLRPYAQLLLQRVEPRVSTAVRVRDALTELLPSGFPSRAGVARRLGVGARTLARELEAEKTTYSAVVDDLRVELAIRRLQEGRTPIGEIACELGFRDQSAFTKFFKRSVGTTPSEYRQRYAFKQ